MMIEFFGPPGAGKTTVAQALSREINATVVVLGGRRERWLGGWYFCLKRPRLAAALLFLVIKETRKSWPLFRRTLHQLFKAWAITIKAEQLLTSARLIIIDEGLAQFFFSLYNRPVLAGELKNYFQRFVFSDFLVLLTAPLDLCRRRMVERGRIPRFHTGLNYQSWLRIIDQNNRLLLTESPLLDKELLVESTIDDSSQVIARLLSKIRNRQR